MRQLKFDLTKNTIVCGDCCDEQGEGWLNAIPDSSIDLIYIDPPFFSNKNYEIVWGNGYELRSFGDRFKGGIKHYIDWMEPKIKEAKRVLKDTGSIFLHCDWHASHRLRCLLDDIFGEKKFVNEIIWCYHGPGSPNMKQFNRKHDTIFWYHKKLKWVFNREEIRVPYKDPKQTLRRAMSTSGKFTVLESEEQRKKGKVPEDWWVMRIVARSKKENIGYKTQKPEMLIKRIIECCTKEKNLVLDFFGGGGTTAKVCKDLNRRFITGDVSPVACRVTADRLYFHSYRDYEIKGLPSTKKEYLEMNPHQFADTICEIMGWQTNQKKSGDGGIDGFANKGKIPIQIKNHKNKTGRPDIQKFLGAINKYKKGLFVSWGFSPEAWEFKAEIKDKELEFLEIGKLLNGLLISDNESAEHKKLYKERVKKDFRPAESQLTQKQDIQKVREQSKRKRKTIKEEQIN